MNRTELKQLARIRLREAKILLDSGNYNGAYYLAGYVIECALKACIAKQIRNNVIPDRNFCNDFYKHNLSDLVRFAGIETERINLEHNNANFAANWAVVKDWKESSRYETFTRIQAKELYNSIASRNGGVLKWIRTFW